MSTGTRHKAAVKRTEPAPARTPSDSTDRSITALVVGTDDWAIEQSAARLRANGHRVLTCHEPGEAVFPCNALIAGRKCPLDIGFDVAVTARARPTEMPTMSEFGAVCALHAGSPLVVSGIAERDPFRAWAAQVVTERGDVARACEDLVLGEKTAEIIQLPSGDVS